MVYLTALVSVIYFLDISYKLKNFLPPMRDFFLHNVLLLAVFNNLFNSRIWFIFQLADLGADSRGVEHHGAQLE